MDLSTLSLDELVALQTEKRDRFNAIKAMDTPSRKEVEEALALAGEFKDITTAIADKQGEADATDEEREALSALNLDEEPEPEVVAEVVEEPVEVVVETPVEVVVEVTEPEPVAAAVKAAVVLAGQRPVVPVKAKEAVTITAAADTGYATGSTLTLTDAGQAVINRLKGFGEPQGDGESEDLRTFGVATIGYEFPEDLQVGKNMSEEAIHEVLVHAADETRLEGESLTASAGWCAPSETLYDLCAGEVVDGILSLPEVQVNRGGFKHTTGIDFSTIYAGVGFLQTEAQAISGTTKTSYEVPCPTFVDERLDAIGLFIKVPILLNEGYPEVVQRIMSGSLIAHQYKVNASVITRVVAKAGAALDFTPDLTAVTFNTLNGVDLVAEQQRQKWRLGANATLEAVFPVWARSVFRNDIGARTGRDKDAVSDAEIISHFSVRNINVQFVYGWQELTGSELTWPAALNFLMYPAGTLVKGTAPIINLSAVYDAASLAVNLYTGLFFEQGLLVAQMCYQVVQATVPVTGGYSGKTGAASL